MTVPPEDKKCPIHDYHKPIDGGCNCLENKIHNESNAAWRKHIKEADIEGEIRRCGIGYIEENQDIVRISIPNISEVIHTLLLGETKSNGIENKLDKHQEQGEN